jgi:hypothetical protein
MAAWKRSDSASHQKAVAAWRQANEQLQAAQAKLTEGKSELEVLMNLAAKARLELDQTRYRLEQHRVPKRREPVWPYHQIQGAKPDDFDPAWPQWVEQDRQLENQVKAASARLDQVATKCELARLELVKRSKAVEQLLYVEHNAQELARGVQPAQGWQGEVRTVR